MTRKCKTRNPWGITANAALACRKQEPIVRPLPCPFCGSENLRIAEYGIECRICGVWMGDGTQRLTIGKTLLDSWNHRANIPLCVKSDSKTGGK